MAVVTKAFGYIRVSGKGQVDGDGFARQEAAIRSYAKVHGIKLESIYREEGVSGTTEVRPALADMLVSLEQNGHGIKLVIIEKLDRLARDLMVQEAIVHDLRKGGFRLVSALEGADLLENDPSRKLIRQVFGAIAEYDKAMTVAKLRAARERKKAATGRCEGRKAFTKDTLPEAIRTALEVVRRLRKVNPGQRRPSFAEVAQALNANGLQTVQGKSFTAANLMRMWREHRKLL
jgi:DNA invertase Pin-like site-specific DNA recombinase